MPEQYWNTDICVSNKANRRIALKHDLSMIKIKEGRSFRDPEVVTVSKILDAVLDRYQVMLMIKKTEKG
ncbi:hypothetical protein JCM17380_53340 [Desulfosporosinus burensis]